MLSNEIHQQKLTHKKKHDEKHWCIDYCTE